MNTEIAMKIYYSSLKAGAVVLINYFLNMLLNKGVKMSLWRTVVLFLFLFSVFFYFDRYAHAYEIVDQHTRGEYHSIEYPDADVDDINFSNPSLHSLVPRENLTRREYPGIDLCPKCQTASRDCSTCGKCYQCHRCYMCHTQKLSCHDCHHQLSNKKCHLCRCKPCVDAKHAKKKQEEEERRQSNNAAYTKPSESRNESIAGQSRSTGRLLSPDEMDLIDYKAEDNFLIEKKTPLETEEEIERYLRSLGITVSYEYTSYWEGLSDVITSDFQIWGPSEISKKIYLSQKTQNEMKEEMFYFRELGELYFNTAIEKLKGLPMVSDDQALSICLAAWGTALIAGPDPRTKIISSFSVALTTYLGYKIKECREFCELMQKAFDCNREADNLEELLNRCTLPHYSSKNI